MEPLTTQTRVMGLETEYMFSVQCSDGKRMPQDEALHHLMQLAAAELPHLRGLRTSGMFLENGARLYTDMGHPEFSTPEVTTPWDAVRYQLAGDRILAHLAESLRRQPGVGDVTIGKGCVDYSGTGATWGSHESYGCFRAPDRISAHLIPHLVSRIIYAGAGGFDNLKPGLCFRVSPRAGHLVHASSDSTTHDRGIYNERVEPLTRGSHGYHRVHVIAGESLCSQTASLLRVGTTALVVSLIEKEVDFARTVGLDDPITALQTVARDTNLSAEVILGTGEICTAIDIQRRYLKIVLSYLDQPWMPPWANPVCALWNEVLTRLKTDPKSLATKIDWMIKHSIYSDWLVREGRDWEWAEQCSATMARWALDVHETMSRRRRRPRRPEEVPSSEFSVLSSEPNDLQLNNENSELRTSFQRLNAQMFDADSRFADLDPNGVFNQLDAAGVLSHRVGAMEDIDAARKSPPPDTRARLRGECVRSLASQADRYGCEWNGVLDNTEGRYLNLSTPLLQEAAWVPVGQVRRSWLDEE